MKFNDKILNEATKLNISEEELNQAFRKGFAAWKPGQVPGSTPHQLGFAVVEQFLAIKREQLDEVNNEPVKVSDGRKDDKEVEKRSDSDKKVEKKKKPASKESKYSNKQPSGDQVDSSIVGGNTFFGIGESLPEHPDIKSWMLAERTQKDYTKRYGKNAKSKLLEAGQRIFKGLNEATSRKV